jgi:hypothetical protein
LVLLVGVAGFTVGSSVVGGPVGIRMRVATGWRRIW